MNHARHRRQPRTLRHALISLGVLTGCTLGAMAIVSQQEPPRPQHIEVEAQKPQAGISVPTEALTFPRVSIVTAPAPVIEPAPEPVQDWTPEPPTDYITAPVQGWTAALPVAPTASTPVTSGVGCQEDNPCWDCKTMGNMICGPVVTGDLAVDAAAEQTMAWATFDEAGGGLALKVDYSRPYRVDYMGVTPDYPENTDQFDLPLQGADCQWYTFRATYTDVPEDTSSFEEAPDMS